MKKYCSILLLCLLLVIASPAMANLDDTMETITQRYGDYRLVIDTDNQPWTREQWEKSGYKKAQADTYTYRFTRGDSGIGLDVKYEGNKPGSYVRMLRFTPDMPIQIKDFKALFPEIYSLLALPQTVVFASYKQVSRNLAENNSPVTMGAAIKKTLAGERKEYFALMAFSVQDEGRLVKDPKYIDENTYIREFTLERTYLAVIKENLTVDWKEIKNYFAPTVKQEGASTDKPAKKKKTK